MKTDREMERTMDAIMYIGGVMKQLQYNLNDR